MPVGGAETADRACWAYIGDMIGAKKQHIRKSDRENGLLKLNITLFEERVRRETGWGVLKSFILEK
jgi:hypothetical protein